MSTDVISSAILSFVNSNAYPESEGVISAELHPEALTNVLGHLRKERDEAKQEIRSLSSAVAPDIDTWIAFAKELQADILRSRDTARQIVAEHDKGRDLRGNVEDAGNKLVLLEKEVGFNEMLEGSMEHVRYANGMLSQAQDEAVQGCVELSMARLEEADSSISGLQGLGNTRTVAFLEKRAAQLKENLGEAVTRSWNSMVVVEPENKTVTINELDPQYPENTMQSIANAMQSLGLFDRLLLKLSRDLDQTLFKPMLFSNSGHMMGHVSINGSNIRCTTRSDRASSQDIVDDLRAALAFISTRLPPSVHVPLSERLVPALISRLEKHWLEPSIPLDISQMGAFESTLSHAVRVADDIRNLGWSGSQPLRDWVKDAPRAWLTKRREVVLGDVRNLVFADLRETKVVERVETQMVSKGDTLAGQVEGGDDDWDTAWEETDEHPPDTGHKTQPHEESARPADADDEDASAWEVDDSEDTDGQQEDGPEDAWGWGDEDRPSGAKPEVTAGGNDKTMHNDRQSPSTKPPERELTLRETYTVTAVPDGILQLIQQIISDAETVAGPKFYSSTISPAAAGLYSLPTLAIAIYRATAPTAYAKVPTGNMLIYNDATRLSEQLRSWQASQPPASRLRLDNDAKALDLFAKRAYSAEMDSQRTILRDLLDGAQGFSNCTVSPYKQECESAVEQTVDRLRDVHVEWKSILAQSALLQSLGSLLAAVTGKMIIDVEELGDIAESESQQLKALCERVSAAKDLFAQQTPEGSASDMTFIYCPNWLKFQYMAEILESSLADIKYLWNDGELSLEFEAEEVVELIEALFAESDMRRKAIADIRRSSRR